jgi:hypothetical protein
LASPLLPLASVTPQGIRKKYNKFSIIFNSSTQTSPDEAVLNHVTTTDLEANINFGQAKTNLFINIYNWQVSHPDKIIYLALADISACFRLPRISANVTGAFGFMAEGYHFCPQVTYLVLILQLVLGNCFGKPFRA